MPTGQYIRKPYWKCFLEKIDSTGECWTWKGAVGTNGYGRFGMNNRTFQAHRVSWELFNFKLWPPLHDLWILHRCDNRLCVNPEHLFLGDRQLNVDDCIAKRRHTFGEKSKLSKLKKEQVNRIRELWNNGHTSQQKIADEFHVDQTTIHYIVTNKTWKELI